MAALSPTPAPSMQEIEAAQAFAFAKTLTLPGDDPLCVFPDASVRLLSASDLNRATPYELEWAWREIAAKHGLDTFHSHDFSDRAWYDPDADFTNERLSQVESMNIINIRNAALSHYSNIKTVRNNRARADLDGDGTQEAFSFSADRFASQGRLQIAGNRFVVELPQLDGRIYLCDLDHSDHYLELGIPFSRPGNDYAIAFYRYRDNELIPLGEVPGDRSTLRLFGDGTLDGDALGQNPGLWRYRLRYTLQNDSLIADNPAAIPIGILTATAGELTLTDEQETAFVLPRGSPVVLLAKTRWYLILYHSDSGRMGMLPFEEADDLGELFTPLPTFA